MSAVGAIVAWDYGQIDALEAQEDNPLPEILAARSIHMASWSAWPNCAIGAESFYILDANSNYEYAAPLRIISYYQAIAHVSGDTRPLLFQSPSEMRTVSDERLERWGFWIPGQEHARAATKHALGYLRACKKHNIGKKYRNTAWPEIFPL